MANPRPTFLSLPTEIRLYIAAYAVDQGPHYGRQPNPWGHDVASKDGDKRLENIFDEPPYRSSANLQILLVCRQFRHDFTPVAWESTTFELFWRDMPEWVVASIPGRLVRHVRKVVVHGNAVQAWTKWPFNEDYLKLDQMTVWEDFDHQIPGFSVRYWRDVVSLKVIQVLFFEMDTSQQRRRFQHLVRLLWERDFEERYGKGESEPNGGDTWWEGELREGEGCIVFQAQKPRPMLEYLQLMDSKLTDPRSIKLCKIV